VNAVKVVQVGDIADDPNLVAIQEHDFSGACVGRVEIGLPVELVGIGNAWSQIRR
jgi:hypothetical protein